LAKLFGSSWEWALLVGRVVLGAIFIAQGYNKLFVMGIGGEGGLAAMFNMWGIPAPVFFAWLVALVEFFGGIAVLLGLLTRYAALALAVVMVVAIFTVTLEKGFLGGYDINLALIALSLSVLFAGPGKLSLEKVLMQREL